MGKIIVYGIPNCDTTKKALAWFKKHAIQIEFHDYKQSGISKEKLAGWIADQGLELILNKRSTTWKELPRTVQEGITGIGPAIELMLTHNTLIKRPVIAWGNKITVGYDEHVFSGLFSKKQPGNSVKSTSS